MTIKKTIHELAKEFPEKTYRELEKYRDADRQEEAASIPLTESQKSQDKLEPIGMGHNHPPDEREEQDNPTLWELAKEHNVNYADAVPIQEDKRLKKEAKIEAAKIKKDVSEMDKLKKRAQEAEGELTILKGIETNRVKEAQARSNQLQDEADKVKKENNDLYNKIADLTEVTKSKDYFRDPDYKFLVEENRKLEEERNELLMDNKKLAAQIEDRINRMRKSGM